MSILVDAETKVLVQGLTGNQGRFYGLRNRAYGTKVVGGVSAIATIRSRRAGSNFLGRPVPTFGFKLSKPKSLKA